MVTSIFEAFPNFVRILSGNVTNGFPIRLNLFEDFGRFFPIFAILQGFGLFDKLQFLFQVLSLSLFQALVKIIFGRVELPRRLSELLPYLITFGSWNLADSEELLAKPFKLLDLFLPKFVRIDLTRIYGFDLFYDCQFEVNIFFVFLF